MSTLSKDFYSKYNTLDSCFEIWGKRRLFFIKTDIFHNCNECLVSLRSSLLLQNYYVLLFTKKRTMGEKLIKRFLNLTLFYTVSLCQSVIECFLSKRGIRKVLLFNERANHEEFEVGQLIPLTILTICDLLYNQRHSLMINPSGKLASRFLCVCFR